MSEAPPPSCPLCDSSDVLVEDELTGADVAALWKACDRQFSDAAMRPLTNDTRVMLQRCRACGFRFYDRALAGSARFYEELMTGGYYAENRPEFEFALRFIAENNLASVLDVGGGAGGFLDLARGAGAKTFGAELNPAAAAAAAAKGHHMTTRRLEDLTPADMGGGVDMVTLHQVVEHVPDPVAFVRHASRLARPGGFIMVAVPNEHRICGLVPFDPANWPPHHLTRWRRRDLRALATKAGLSVAREGADELHGAALESFIPLHNRLAEAIGRRPYPVEQRGARVISRLYRKLGLKHLFPRLGLSIYLIAQKPAPSP